METTQTVQHMPVTGVKKWLPLIILCMAVLVIVLDTTILNVSLRTIIGDLGTTIQKIQWVITAYSLTLAAFTITGGRLGDLFGRKKMFAFGALLFAIGSFITSISHSVGVMVLGEAIIEGIGAALMMPATTSLLVSNYSGRDRQVAFGVWGGIAAAGAALGPVFGGWLTTYYSWRWAFRINIFIVIFLILGSFLIKESKDQVEKAELDFVGILLSAAALFLIVFGFIETSTYGWWTAKEVFMIGTFSLNLLGNLSVVVLSLVWGVALLLLFVLWELYTENKGHTPLVSMGLFKNTQFTLGASIMAIISLGLAGMSFTIPVFFQAVKNLDAYHTGLAMLPMSLTLLIVAPLTAYISKFTTPKRIIQAGLIIAMAGFLGLIFGIQTTTSVWALTPGFILFGMGMGCIMSQVSNMTLSAVPVYQVGEASGVNGTTRTIGQTLGSAILGAILLSTLSSNIVSGIKSSTVIPERSKSQVVEAVSKQTSSIEFGGGAALSSTIPQNIADEIKSISHTATVTASHTTLFGGIGFLILGFILSFKLPNKKNVEIENKPMTTAH